MDNTTEVLRAAALDLTRTLDLDSVLSKLLEHLERLVPYDTANVMLIEDGSRLAIRALRGYERWGDAGVTQASAFDLATHPILGAITAGQRSILIADTHVYPGWQRNAGAEHVRNWIGVPLVAAGEGIGLYAVDKHEPSFFTEEHVRLTEALAPHASIAIQNARLFQRLQANEERFRALVENSAEGIAMLDRRGRVLYASPSSTSLGMTADALAGRSAIGRTHPEDADRARELFAMCLRNPGVPIPAELRVRREDGAWRVIEGVLVSRLDEPNVGGVVVNYRDVTTRWEARQRIEALNRHLQRQVAEFRTLLEVIPIGIGIARDPGCHHVDANPYLERLLGIPSGINSAFGGPDGLTGVSLFRGGRPLEPAEMPMQQAAGRGVDVTDVEMDVVRDGRTVATILGSARPLFDEAGRPRGAIGTALDITERKRSEEQIRALAYHDTLTGLPNRLLFGDRLSLAVAQAHRQSQGLAVLFLDLDRFKLINDSLGHSVGDRLIRGVADRLTTCVREGDTVARLGGDEFTLLLPAVEREADAARVADKVLDVLRVPFALEGRELFVTASMGISLYPADGHDAETLVKNADTAMYRAKEDGRDNYRIYAHAMNATALERLALENSLRRALANEELVLYYQPLMNLASGSLHGMEALLRWQHPELGIVKPTDFIPIAEITGLILPIGPWVLKTACAQARRWQLAGHDGLSMAVNLSARQFQQPDLVAQVRRALDETGLPPRSLEIEITESNAMQNGETTVRTLQDLKSLGVRLSIDDFGTGYSSLGYLRRFPIDTLKIDQSFVRDLTDDPDDAAIVSTMIAMARTLKLEVVAEGIETPGQLAFLADHGCDRGQGYQFSPPLPAREWETRLGEPALRG